MNSKPPSTGPAAPQPTVTDLMITIVSEPKIILLGATSQPERPPCTRCGGALGAWHVFVGVWTGGVPIPGSGLHLCNDCVYTKTDSWTRLSMFLKTGKHPDTLSDEELSRDPGDA